MINLHRAAAALVVALVVACKGDSTGPVAGTLTVKLTSPNNGLDGAVYLVLKAPAVPQSVSAGTGLVLWSGPVTNDTAKVVLTGTLTSGPILTLQVDDVNKVGQYSVELKQISSTTYTLRPLTGYSASVTK